MFFDPMYFLVLAPAFVFALWASWRTKSNFKKYSRVPVSSGLSGAEAAQRVLDGAGISDVDVVSTRGLLTDHYNPMKKTLNLSQGVYGLPGIQGLISLAFAGLLYENEPEKAYVKAFELDFRGVGYSRDATAMMAAMVSAALGGDISAKEMSRIGLETDPFGLGKRKYDGRVMSSEVSALLSIAEEADNDRALVEALSRRICHRHFYDPVDVLGFPMAGLHFCNGDAIRTIVMAVNDREFDENGRFVRLRDVDCTGSVAGALVGALNGAQAFPRDWVDDVISANMQVYGIDIEGNARRFYEAVYGAK